MDSTVGLMLAVFRLYLEQFSVFATITVLFVCFFMFDYGQVSIIFNNVFKFSMNSFWLWSCGLVNFVVNEHFVFSCL